ncbi:hypothetical protein CLK_1849 [Clostridium botulinum A3 str. Loch Maree]|nr:hypothetical protein CLK_1849 [Clostridium botulinum A3 str. Loch Maree]
MFVHFVFNEIVQNITAKENLEEIIKRQLLKIINLYKYVC